MTLNQALTLIRLRREIPGKKPHYLACGFEPLHLGTLLRGRLLERLPEQNVELGVGQYGDLLGNVKRAGESGAIGAAVVVEWSDLDPRLGLRASGGWGKEARESILVQMEAQMGRLEEAIGQLGLKMPVAVASPALPLPPVGGTSGAQSSGWELELRAMVAGMMARLGRREGVRVVRGESEPVALDARMELKAGFPYTMAFASERAAGLSAALWPRAPKKGLITDLDDTLWGGIAGEIGPAEVSWSQDSHTQVHGLYQQMLGHLSGMGVLLGICSKNEPATVAEGLGRKDLLVEAQAFYPVEASWGAKSAAVGRILKAWNIAADAVVFVDDNPMELAEVEQAHPGIQCLRFTPQEPERVWELLGQLGDLFGKPRLEAEDLLRQSSIRAAAEFAAGSETGTDPEFLSGLGGQVGIDWDLKASAQRALELINKTNQFNLNGLRLGEGEWSQRLEQDSLVGMVVSYQDRLGALGRVGVLLGETDGDQPVRVTHWVLSCRAFSRRIEHHTLAALFARTGAGEVEFALEATERNQPLREFLSTLGVTAEGKRRLSREEFEAAVGELPHQVNQERAS